MPVSKRKRTKSQAVNPKKAELSRREYVNEVELLATCQTFADQIVKCWLVSESKAGIVRVQKFSECALIEFIPMENITDLNHKISVARDLERRKPNQIPVVYISEDGIVACAFSSFEFRGKPKK